MTYITHSPRADCAARDTLPYRCEACHQRFPKEPENHECEPGWPERVKAAMTKARRRKHVKRLKEMEQDQ